MSLYVASNINLIFVSRELAAVLAHVGSHCVTGIALPPVDATFLSLSLWLLARGRGKLGCVSVRFGCHQLLFFCFWAR